MTTLRDPFLRISGPGGVELVRDLGRDFVGVIITDREGGENDECVIRIRRSKPYRLPPAKDTEFTVSIGWDEAGALVTGTYRFQRVIYSGDPQAGEEMGLVCRAPDADALKQVDSEHFDAETGHETYGDVLRTLAERAGLGAAIDPEIAKIPLAGGYLLRWKQSAIGLATDLADELGAIVKPQAGQLTVRARGAGKSASGQALQRVTVSHDPAYAWQADIEPRYGFGAVAGAWFDGGRGRPLDEVLTRAGSAARFGLPHLLGGLDIAKKVTAAAAQRFQEDTATAVFERSGTALAVAGSPITVSGFGPDVDQVQWKAETVTHDAGPGRGWITTIEARNSEGDTG